MSTETSSEQHFQHLFMRWSRISTAVFTALIIFLLPIKFGNVLYPGTIGLFPLSALEWVVTQWPPSLFPLLSGLSLISVVLTYPLPSLTKRLWLVPASWLVPLILSLPALGVSTEISRAAHFLWNLLATATLSAAVLIIIRYKRKFGAWVLLAVAAGSMLTAADAWYEVVGGGLEDTLAYMQEQAQITGVEISSGVRERLLEGRASGLFVYPNSLAAYLVMVIPIGVLAVWRLGKHFEPVSISRPLFAGVFLFVTIPALVWSGSRCFRMYRGCFSIIASAVVFPAFK